MIYRNVYIYTCILMDTFCILIRKAQEHPPGPSLPELCGMLDKCREGMTQDHPKDATFPPGTARKRKPKK